MNLRTAFALLTTLGAIGCMAQYKFPTPGEPHAILKVRRQYIQTPGTALSELVAVNEQKVFSDSVSTRNLGATRTNAVLLHPGPAEIRLRSTFTHQVTRTRTRQESYSCGSYESPRTCYRTKTESYTDTVVDAACDLSRTMNLEDGASYIVDLDFHDSRNCRMRCVQQIPDGPGKFKNNPCP